jgi:hypothetical protein
MVLLNVAAVDLCMVVLLLFTVAVLCVSDCKRKTLAGRHVQMDQHFELVTTCFLGASATKATAGSRAAGALQAHLAAAACPCCAAS